MKRVLVLVAFLLISFWGFSQGLKAYKIYDKDRNEVSFSEMIRGLEGDKVVFFGEFHNNAINHWLELETTKALYAKKGNRLVLGAEMFERDNQQILNEYLKDSISVEELKEQARLWPNFKTDYKPLVDFAKANYLQFIATNVPRHFAADVAKSEQGIDTLEGYSKADRKLMARLPIKVDMETPGYREMIEMMKGHAGDKAINYVQAQALKDATMAESIRKNRRGKELFLHYNGNFHTEGFGGIYWHLKHRKKRWRIAVISVAESESQKLSMPEDFTPTDYNIIIPADMTKTY